MQYSTIQYNTVQYSTVLYSTVQYSTVQYSTEQYSTVQYSTVQYSTVQYSAFATPISVLKSLLLMSGITRLTNDYDNAIYRIKRELKKNASFSGNKE